ncbi:helix-turn-helix domain-containing protein [Tundrisphaera sp. TA3]|uniref:helix-turn-helix domain-containing protein n=1 Tax=Tundrisphaera sp. TA3 TaxID=3435775 RepID=UPI003EBFDF29
MTLAQRVKDQRYAKGWGPDELAARASISRTALYQIESGRTELPRAGTLRRIAEALEIPTDALLGPKLGVGTTAPWAGPAMPAQAASPKPTADAEMARFHIDGPPVPARDRDLERKFHELLESPLGEGLARIVEESYRILPRPSRAIW